MSDPGLDAPIDLVGVDGRLDAIGAADFRRVLGRFPTGVTVVTAAPAGGPPVGLSVNSFTSASLDPPLVGFLPGAASATWRSMAAVGAFCVNVLADDQAGLAEQFAGPAAKRFLGVEWAPSPRTGSPMLAGTTAWIDCALESVSPAGDHLFVLGRVLAMTAGTGADPLVFHRGAYRRLLG